MPQTQSPQIVEQSSQRGKQPKNWRGVKLRDVISINPDSIGKNFTFEKILYTDISSVGTGVADPPAEMSLSDAPSRARRLVKNGDTILSTVRPNRRSFLYIKNPKENMVVSTGFAVLRAGNKVDSRFLYYLISNQPFTDYLTLYAKGAAYPAVDEDIIANANVILPELSEQRKISDILSTYDDLIENNTKRIKILEEMAQAIYKEWFVYFRFPRLRRGFGGQAGHEKAKSRSERSSTTGIKMVDSKTEFGKIPDGWKIIQMSEVADVIDCLHSKKPENIRIGKNILLQLNNILDNGTVDLAEKYLLSDDDYKKWTSRIELKGGDCIVTNVGRIAAVAQIPVGVRAALGRNMTGIRPQKIPASFLIAYLLSPHMKTEVQRKTDSGAIMDALNVKNIYLLNVILPPQNLLIQFDNLVSPIRHLMNHVVAENQNLRQARDLLLPKLVTGEIRV